jgi:CRP-like cAMP-binding protein|tara:strand:+ start:190 stop:777 length:588 start_codon:yes stop_codon:yes gene_type:complete
MKLQTSDLDQMRLLNGLGPVVKKVSLTHFHVRTYAKNESVVQKGRASAELYFLVSGRLKVVGFIQSGREIGFVFIAPGMHFGELALIDGRPRSASIIATEPSVVLVLPKKQAQQLIFAVPHVSKWLLLQQMEQVEGEAIIECIFTQHEMAIITNTTREIVSRAISQLQGMGVVKKEGKSLMVQNVNALKHLSIDV